jgi:Integrase core domain
MRQFERNEGFSGYDRWMKTVISISRNQEDRTARYRLEVLRHYRKHGLESALDAFPVSRATLFRWQKELKKQKGKLQSLIPKSTRPKNVRRMTASNEVVDKIKELRQQWPNLSKHKLKPLIDVFCAEHHHRSISATTIGEVIRRNQFFYKKSSKMYHNPSHKRREKKSKTRVWKAPEHEMGYVEADCIETRVDGKKKYTVCWIDIGSKVAYSKTYEKKSSTNILNSFLAFEAFHPGNIHTFQTDNGSEFEGAFELFLKTHRPTMKRVYTPIKSPKINGVVERYNRSLQDDWLNHHIHLFHDAETWDQSLAQYIYFYNYQRVHESLQYQTPMQKAGVQKSLICP